MARVKLAKDFETISKKIGKRILLLRQKQGLTQVQLGELAGISICYVSMTERGHNPSVKSLVNLSSALGTTIDDIMEQEGIGRFTGRRTKQMRSVQVDIPTEDPVMMDIIELIRNLGPEDRDRALLFIMLFLKDIKINRRGPRLIFRRSAR